MKTSDKRRDIMQAALELIAGTIYRYFESKDVLITELRRELEEKISATLREGYPVERPLRERFLYLIRELLRHFKANPLDFRYMEQYFNSPYGVSMHRDRVLGKSGKHDIVMEIFKEGISQQILKDLPVLVLFSLAFGPLLSLMRDHIFGFVTLDDPLIKQITEGESWLYSKIRSEHSFLL
jgi:AcrR family transcriptional regulator